VDGTEFRIRRPQRLGDYGRFNDGRWQMNIFWSVKHSQYSLIYCVVTHIVTHEILLLDGFRPGSASDPPHARDALGDALLPNELLGGDGVYASMPWLFVAPFKDPQTDEERVWNRYFRDQRVAIEHDFAHWKNEWPILTNRFRHSLERHPVIVHALAILYNLILRYGSL